MENQECIFLTILQCITDSIEGNKQTTFWYLEKQIRNLARVVKFTTEIYIAI